MDERNSDDDTVEFEIEVISSSSSCLSLNIQDEKQPSPSQTQSNDDNQLTQIDANYQQPLECEAAPDSQIQKRAASPVADLKEEEEEEEVEKQQQSRVIDENNESQTDLEPKEIPLELHEDLEEKTNIHHHEHDDECDTTNLAPKDHSEQFVAPTDDGQPEGQVEQNEQQAVLDLTPTNADLTDYAATRTLELEIIDSNEGESCEEREEIQSAPKEDTSAAELTESAASDQAATQGDDDEQESKENLDASAEHEQPEQLVLEQQPVQQQTDAADQQQQPQPHDDDDRSIVDAKKESEPIGWSLVRVAPPEPTENGWLLVDDKAKFQLDDINSTSSLRTTAEPERIESEASLLADNDEAGGLSTEQVGEEITVIEQQQQQQQHECSQDASRLSEAELTSPADQSADNLNQFGHQENEQEQVDPLDEELESCSNGAAEVVAEEHNEKIDIEFELVDSNRLRTEVFVDDPLILTLSVRKPRLSFSEDYEDLEREFDEEPEFQRRQVVVKRNCQFRNEYQPGDELGRGRFGTVLKCTELATGLNLAAKFVHLRRREDRADVEREIQIMSILQHKRLLQLYDAFDDGQSEMCLVTELVDGGELFERIVDDDFDLTEKKAAIFMRQICEGVDYMQSQKIVHLDMKPENILCLSRTSNRIKLIDFGLARQLDPNEPLRVMFGTPDFAAPEVLTYEMVTLATDMWSVGVICYVLLSGLSPFMGDNDMETMANVMQATFDFESQAFDPISDLAKDFISKLLIREPSERLKPSECLQHAWLQRGGAQLEAAVRERRESTASIMINNPHQFQSTNTLEHIQLVAAASAAFSAMSASINNAGGAASPTLSSAETSSSLISLDKRNLKRYVVRRKWHKTVHAIMALGRMGANLKNKL